MWQERCRKCSHTGIYTEYKGGLWCVLLSAMRGDYSRTYLSGFSVDLAFLVFLNQLMDIASLTNDVKNQAMTTLKKAQKKKDDFEQNNKELKDFIKKIRDFLTGILMF